MGRGSENKIEDNISPELSVMDISHGQELSQWKTWLQK